NYSGHGTTGAWGKNNPVLFSNLSVPQLTNANNLSIYTMLTCLNGFFHQVSAKSLAENLVESTNGGAVAAWASTGETTPDVQEVMATQFYHKIGEGQILRLGDLVNDAKTVIPGGTDVRLSWALIGDPMLKVH
ncbi:MAG TPA: C25 family cysteine peptidase, partial [Pyrinomonadaceae bacterium]|nr:C25 family cysteine peptidase [Pyrinomonadaceae bacterium]